MAKKKSALSKSPSNKAKTQAKPSKNPMDEYRSLQGRNDPQSRQRRRSLMKEIQAQRRSGQQQQPSPYQLPQQGIGQGMQNFIEQMQQQGAFNPGSFQDQMNQAYGNVMQQFEQSTGAQFAKQNRDFEQMAAERGLDPAGEAYRSMRAELGQQQDMARQAAMNQAWAAAQNAQAQGFGQAATQYQMPGQMLGAFAQFYGQMGEDVRQQQQFGFQGQQNALDRQTQERLANIQARSAGAGSLSLQDRMALLDRETANQMALNMSQGGGGTQPSQGGGFDQGLAQGVGLAIPGVVQGMFNRGGS